MNVGYNYVSASSTIYSQIYSLNPKNKPIREYFHQNMCNVLVKINVY